MEIRKIEISIQFHFYLSLLILLLSLESELGQSAVKPLICSGMLKAISISSTSFEMKGLMTLSSKDVGSKSLFERDFLSGYIQEIEP